MFADCTPFASQEQSFRNVEHHLPPLDGEEPDELKEEDELNDPSPDEGEDMQERPEASVSPPVNPAPAAAAPRRTRAQMRAAREAEDEDRHPELEDSLSSSSAEGVTVPSPEKEKRMKKKHSPLRVKEELREKLEKEREAAGGPYVELRRAMPPLDEEPSAPTTATTFFG